MLQTDIGGLLAEARVCMTGIVPSHSIVHGLQIIMRAKKAYLPSLLSYMQHEFKISYVLKFQIHSYHLDIKKMHFYLETCACQKFSVLLFS